MAACLVVVLCHMEFVASVHFSGSEAKQARRALRHNISLYRANRTAVPFKEEWKNFTLGDKLTLCFFVWLALTFVFIAFTGISSDRYSRDDPQICTLYIPYVLIFMFLIIIVPAYGQNEIRKNQDPSSDSPRGPPFRSIHELIEYFKQQPVDYSAENVSSLEYYDDSESQEENSESGQQNRSHRKIIGRPTELPITTLSSVDTRTEGVVTFTRQGSTSNLTTLISMPTRKAYIHSVSSGSCRSSPIIGSLRIFKWIRLAGILSVTRMASAIGDLPIQIGPKEILPNIPEGRSTEFMILMGLACLILLLLIIGCCTLKSFIR